METCTTCFTDYLVQCTEEINVFAQLAPATQYQWVIKDKFDQEYADMFTTDGDGFWTIPVDQLPPGLLNAFIGPLFLQVYGEECKPIKFKMAQEYDCIQFEVRGGNREKNSLGCNFTCVAIPSGGQSSAIFPFSGAALIDLPWTDLLRTLYGNQPVVNVYHTVNGITQQVTGNVVVELTGGAYLLENIHIDNGGPADGYIIVSN